MMKKIFKKILILLIIITTSINTFASIVSDNDGSAFITKAEFEALKKGFADQITNYEDSISEKIDGAIANYLAGIDLAKKEIIKSNISFISYPLRVINALDGMINLDSPVNNQTAPFYSPGYSMYGFIHRGYSTEGRTGIGLLEIKPSRKWQKWLHGNWDSSVTKFTIDGMSDSLDYVFSGATYHDGDHNVNDLEAYFLSLDYYNATSQISGQANGYNRSANTSNRLLNDYESYTNTDGALACVFSPAIFAGVSGATTSVRFNYGSTDSLDTWKFTGANNIWYNRVKCKDSLRTFSYNPTKTSVLSEIYNCGLYYDSSVSEYNVQAYKKYLAPVTMGNNQTIYLTNLKKCRQVVNNSDTSKSGWWKHYTRQTTTGFTFTGVITTGYNIESEYSSSPKTGTNAHPKNKRSAIKQNDVYYNFTDADGKNIEHHMVDGIPIESFEKSYREKIDKVIVNFNIASYQPSSSSNKKYAIFSTKPIKTQKYDANVESNTDYIKIKKVNGTDVGNIRKIELAEGENKIELEEDSLKGGDILYVKLLWNDSSEGYITISELPSFEIQAYKS